MDHGKTIMQIQMLVIGAYIMRQKQEGSDESSDVLARRWIDDHGLEFRKLFQTVCRPHK
jgi:hypothetical protein